MLGFLTFCDKYRDEPTCIQAIADLKWPDGFICDKCRGRKAYHLTSRPRLFECSACGHQHSITAGTVFHKTRTDLRKWFMAAYLIGHDKRGVSALFFSREFSIRYETAWLMCHKLRHALTESGAELLLHDLVEIDQTFYGDNRRKNDRGWTQTAAKALLVCAVEKVSTAGTRNKGIAKQGFIAGSARIAVLANAAAENLDGFIRSNIEAGTLIVSSGFRHKAGLDECKHLRSVEGIDLNVGVNTPIIHKLFSNIKAWLNGTHHGVSVKHLPRYLREWSYRFNRRRRVGDLDGFLLRRAVNHRTITYAELVAGRLVEGAA